MVTAMAIDDDSLISRQSYQQRLVFIKTYLFDFVRDVADFSVQFVSWNPRVEPRININRGNWQVQHVRDGSAG